MVRVEPGFELVANIVVTPDRGNFFAVFQVKIGVGLPTIAKRVPMFMRFVLSYGIFMRFT